MEHTDAVQMLFILAYLLANQSAFFSKKGSSPSVPE